MIIEPQMFPSDVNGILGNLRKELTNAIHRSTTSKDSYELVKATLKAGIELLGDVKKEAEANAKARALKLAGTAEPLESPLFEIFSAR